MPRNLNALRVHELTSQLLEGGYLKQEPAWYRPVISSPPSHTLARGAVPHHSPTSTRTRSHTNRNPVNIRYPQRIFYREDALRKKFYRDHPWELARPRSIVEDTGDDHRFYDWSKLVQEGKPTDGESVVQYQLWLMNCQHLPERTAYQMATQKFYSVRIGQDIDRRIAKEEQEAFGLEFFPGPVDVGVELEQKQIADWREKAAKQVEQRTAATSDTEFIANEEDKKEGGDEEEDSKKKDEGFAQKMLRND